MEKTYKVEGMTCQGCVQSVTFAIRRLSPDLKVDVSLKQGTVRVRGEQDEASVRKAIEAAGFRLGPEESP